MRKPRCNSMARFLSVCLFECLSQEAVELVLNTLGLAGHSASLKNVTCKTLNGHSESEVIFSKLRYK